MIETLKQAVEALETMAEFSSSRLEDIRYKMIDLIAQLEKQEPVAYWSEMYQCYSFDQKYCDSVPLYTHPAPAVPDDFMQQIEQWSQAYPLDIFPELTKEEWKRARRALDGSLVKLDRISASVIRHVITRVKEMLSAAPEYEGEK